MGRAKATKPSWDWRAFGFEIAVVVIGVLLALGLGEIAQAVAQSRDAAAARNSIALELTADISRVNQRGKTQACVDRRIEELQAIALPTGTGTH